MKGFPALRAQGHFGLISDNVHPPPFVLQLRLLMRTLVYLAVTNSFYGNLLTAATCFVTFVGWRCRVLLPTAGFCIMYICYDHILD